ncbi:hypothetical protein OG948_60535 (plasmid) [Embleya sp. NBC_00888]|uniref:hypothetical protein n=1 Tax=Embleya sp. NBC_00888 TaxID=2975960 RepID=UPI002F916EF3|nr:hypothetical protein OG948_60535 [Embleya sp. NBC_00888]
MTETSNQAPGNDEDGLLPIGVLSWIPEDFHEGDGREWEKHIRPLWYVVPNWGMDGWDLGSHPNSVVAHYDDILLGTHFGLAVYTEGDVQVSAFQGRHARDAATDRLALELWDYWENGPSNAPKPGTPVDEIPFMFRGSYQRR